MTSTRAEEVSVAIPESEGEATDRANGVVARGIRWLVEAPAVAVMFAMVVLVSANAISRAVWGTPIPDTLEWSSYIMLPLVAFLGFVLAQHRNDHISTELLFRLMPSRTRPVVASAVYGVSTLVMGLMAWYMLDRTLYAYERGLTAGLTSIPIWPPLAVGTVVVATLAVQFAAASVRALRAPAAEATDTDDAPVSGKRSWIVLGAVVVVAAVSISVMFAGLGREAIGMGAIGLMMALIFIRMPIAIAMIVPSLLGLWAFGGEPVVAGALSEMAYKQVSAWTLTVVPMFVFMGLVLWKAGLTESLYGAARTWLRWLPGNLAVGTNVAGAGLASVSGSTVGTTYALARVGIPEMLRAGYDRRFAIGAVLVSGLPGQLIPPSIMLVLYAGIAQVPIGEQLMAGVGPGVLVAVLFSITLAVMAMVRPKLAGGNRTDAVPQGDKWRSLLRIWPVPLIIAVIFVGMFSGVFTATEAGAVAAAISLVVAVIWQWGNRPMRAILEASSGAVASVGAIFFMMVGVEALSRLLAVTGISTAFRNLIESMNLGRFAFVMLMLVVFLILGTFMEPLMMMVLTVPVLLPTLEALDISLLWFGVFVVFMGELAIITPPVGVLTFIIHTICQDPEVNQGQRITMGDIFVAVLFLLPLCAVVVLLLILFPGIVELFL